MASSSFAHSFEAAPAHTQHLLSEEHFAIDSGTTVQKVNNLLRQLTQMSKLFKGMDSGLTGGAKAQQRLLSQMQGKQRFGR